MPKRPHTELRRSLDGPWITLRSHGGSLTFSLRHLVRELMPAESSSSRRRIMAEWLKAREAEIRQELIDPQDIELGERRAPSKPVIPASRRIPRRSLKS
jgi:hypothetical protein